MTQYGRGYSTKVTGTKVEPKAHAVNPAAVDQLGRMLGNHATDNGGALRGASVPLYRGRGLEAPMVSHETCNCGSQGKY